MYPNPALLPPRFLRTREAADFLGLSPRTLEKHRTYGTGPLFRKLGGRVVYAIDELEAWAERGTVASTSRVPVSTSQRGSVTGAAPSQRHTSPICVASIGRRVTWLFPISASTALACGSALANRV